MGGNTQQLRQTKRKGTLASSTLPINLVGLLLVLSMERTVGPLTPDPTDLMF